MKLTYKLTGLFLLIVVTVRAQSNVITLDYRGKKIPVRIIKPEGYTSNKTYPVLIGPGLDNGNLDVGCRYFGPNPGQHGWILVESSIHMENRKAVALLLNHLESNYQTSKVYILGFSANSVDAFTIASIYNNRIHGIIGMPGNPNSQNIDSHKGQQILMIAGERDTYWKNRAERAKVKLDEKGYQNELVIIPKGGHILDELTGKPLFAILNRKLLK
ncbi:MULTISPECIES: hypothetical protein [Flavobacteriaceae]|uniref:hypothetical protein n=1 Tax=Flavobacteriaceae TaxID=49546 RepID=UPI001490F031|nr:MULTISPECIES: hypothetical protein [Allomuricauda]MDC6366682.1 hypothetical protein [Muricauda sp. AC10]